MRQPITKIEQVSGNRHSWLLTLACGHKLEVNANKNSLDKSEGKKFWCWKCTPKCKR